MLFNNFTLVTLTYVSPQLRLHIEGRYFHSPVVVRFSGRCFMKAEQWILFGIVVGLVVRFFGSLFSEN